MPTSRLLGLETYRDYASFEITPGSAWIIPMLGSTSVLLRTMLGLAWVVCDAVIAQVPVDPNERGP